MAIRCAHCNGTGTWSSGCDGVVDCNDCSGTGFIQRGNCSQCKGTGYLESLWNVNRPTCEACKGTGSRAPAA